MIAPALVSSVKMDWPTPREVVELVRSHGDGTIGLDPCAALQGGSVASRYGYGGRHGCSSTASDPPVKVWPNDASGPLDNGLLRSWRGYGLVYCNPPYGREIGRWTSKAAHEFAPGRSKDYERDELIMLVPARVDTGWWQRDLLRVADSILFWKGRLTFEGADQGAAFPSALVYVGTRSLRFRSIFGASGWLVDRWNGW